MFVGAEEQTPTLLSHVNLTSKIDAVKKLVTGCFVVRGDFGEVFGKNVSVFHGQHG
jgi:pectin methylesterase-like acyl-CoA thioesterase